MPTLAAAGLDSLAFAEVQMGRVLASRELTEAMTMRSGRALDHIKEMGQSITAITATVELASSLVSAGRLEKQSTSWVGLGLVLGGGRLWGEAPPHRARALSAMGRDDEAQLELLTGLEIADRRRDPTRQRCSPWRSPTSSATVSGSRLTRPQSMRRGGRSVILGVELA